jgi:hypothetical protein
VLIEEEGEQNSGGSSNDGGGDGRILGAHILGTHAEQIINGRGHDSIYLNL